MRVDYARQIARDLVQERIAESDPIEAAFLHGSITWLHEYDELAPASDVDILVVQTSLSELPIRRKEIIAGMAFDVSIINRSELATAEQVLRTYHLAGSLRSKSSILADLSGWLAPIQERVELEFASPQWARARCDHAQERVFQNLDSLKSSTTLEDQMISWLFAAGVSTHMLLVSGLRNPTVRNRYAALRSMLNDMHHDEMYPPMIDLLDPGKSTDSTISEFVDRLEPLFDHAVRVRRTWFHFAEDLNDRGRIGAIDAARDLVVSGQGRDALFWLAVTSARCMKVLLADGSSVDLKRHTELIHDLARHLGIEDRAATAERSAELISLLPDVKANAELLINERAR